MHLQAKLTAQSRVTNAEPRTFLVNMLFLLPMPLSGTHLEYNWQPGSIGHQDSPPHCKLAPLLPPVTVVDAYERMTGSLVVRSVKSHQYRSFKVDGSDWLPKVLLELEGGCQPCFL